MFDAIRDVLAADQRVTHALVFGSSARGQARADSDLDIAVTLARPLGTQELGDLIGSLELASGRTVDLAILDEAPAPLSYRIFRDGIVVLDRDPHALADRKARAVLDYLDFKPIEDLCVRGVLAAAKHGR